MEMRDIAAGVTVTCLKGPREEWRGMRRRSEEADHQDSIVSLIITQLINSGYVSTPKISIIKTKFFLYLSITN